MQNLKGIIKVFTIVLILVCLLQLSFTFVARHVEKKADEYAAKQVNPAPPANLDALQQVEWQDWLQRSRDTVRRQYLITEGNKPVVDVWGLRDIFTYNLCRERALNLGLDLKGGMSLTLQINEGDVLDQLANKSKDPSFKKAIVNAQKVQANEQTEFLVVFQKEYESINPSGKLSAIFGPLERYKDKIKSTSTNTEVVAVLRGDFDAVVEETFNRLKTRIDQFGVASPNISLQKSTGRITIELPGVDDPTRVRKLLESTAQLEFWETYEVEEVWQYLNNANSTLKLLKAAGLKNADTTAVAGNAATIDTTGAQADTGLFNAGNAATDTSAKAAADTASSDPLWEKLYPSVTEDRSKLREGPTVGQALGKDTAAINAMLQREEVRNQLPGDLKLLWSVHPYGNDVFNLFAIKMPPGNGAAPLTGEVIIDASQGYDETGVPQVTIAMNSLGASKWEQLTDIASNAKVNGVPRKKSIAIVLDNKVYSAPRVQVKISGGRSEITGINDIKEAQDLANILKSGKLNAKTQVIEEQIVGPSLGKESIKAGLLSLFAGFLLVFIFMVAYYSTSGIIANIAMFLNLFILLCTLISIGTAFTLPAIAGVILTLAMAVDANVIINERVREEIARGKGLRLAVEEGYQHSYSAIIDGNLTTMVASIVLIVFGLGPIHGFGLTLFIGLITSMFTAVLVSRSLFDFAFNRNMKISFGNNFTMNLFKHINFDFIGKRKISYSVSAVLFAIAIASIAFYGFDLGVDFKGGRSYVVQFDKDVVTGDVTKKLEAVLGSTPQVKTYGSNNQISITTSYMIDSSSNAADRVVEEKLYEGVKDVFTKAPTMEDFRTKSIKSSVKIGAAVADDIRKSALWAILFGLGGIFLYIFVRFRKFEYATGAVIATIHDPILILGAFSLLRKIMPFSLEIDQNIVAAVLTLIGYSVNDTVVVFDRIREYLSLHPTRSLQQNVNDSINSTLSRTIMTVVTVFIVSLILFLFGGTALKGFSFALIVGLLVGTYSSIFVASPVVVDLMNRKAAKAKKP